MNRESHNAVEFEDESPCDRGRLESDDVATQFRFDAVESSLESNRLTIEISRPARGRDDREWVVQVDFSGLTEEMQWLSADNVAEAMEAAEDCVKATLERLVGDGYTLYWAYSFQPVNVDLLFYSPVLEHDPATKKAAVHPGAD